MGAHLRIIAEKKLTVIDELGLWVILWRFFLKDDSQYGF